MRQAADAAASADRADLATKADLHTAIEPLATKAELATLRSEMRWMFAFQGALILAIAASCSASFDRGEPPLYAPPSMSS